MAVFVVMEVTPNPVLASKIRSVYPNDHLALAAGQWLVSGVGNARTISDSLGLKKGEGLGNTIIFATSSYWGLYSNDVWDWIKTKLEAQQ